MPLVDDLATAVVLEMKNALVPMVERLRAVEARATAETNSLRDRVAALEARPPAPGPPGADGAPGRDGAPGPKGDPGLRYRGVYQEATAYALGDVVTWAGGAWHCNQATTARPGEASPVWTLIVKRGRDAKGAR